MGEFNVNKSDGSLKQTAGMPSEYPATQVMLSDGVTSVEDALDALEIKKTTITATTSSDGRITGQFSGQNIYVIKAYIENQTYIVIPYYYIYSNTKTTNFKVLNSENMAAIASTSVNVVVEYIEQ